MKQKRACKFACLVVGLAMASSMLVGGGGTCQGTGR